MKETKLNDNTQKKKKKGNAFTLSLKFLLISGLASSKGADVLGRSYFSVEGDVGGWGKGGGGGGGGGGR